MSRPNCHLGASGLKECEGLKDLNVLPMSENVCQGEDDLGLYCWGPPSFKGWDKHWGGIHIYNSPFTMTNEDPDDVSLMRKSLSRLDYVDVMYAGYDGSTKNTSAAVYVEGVPPLINGMHVSRSARDGFFFYESSGPIAITNSTIDFNRGHGIAVDNTTDGRLFVNSTIINNNFGDGIWYKQRRGGIQLVKTLPNDRTKRQVSYFEEESDRIDICKVHALSPDHYFPHLIKLNLKNGTYYDSNLPPLCWMTFQLPPRLSYTYTLQFIDIINKNGPQLESKTTLQICDGVSKENKCRSERYSIPIYHHVYPQSITLKSNSQPIYMALNHDLGPYTNGKVGGDIELRFKVHASVLDKGIYGLNVTNSFINNNTGCGVRAMEIRDRTCLSNVTIEQNEGLAGFLVKDGAADIWVNGSSINHNWGDGMNVSFAGGAINFNGSTLIGNRWRGFAFHQNETLPFLPLRHEIVFKGRPSNNQFYLRTRIEKNVWGGILIGNYCTPAFSKIEPRVFINWVEFGDNEYHPSFELFSCQRIFPLTLPTIFDFSGNRIENGTGIGLRIEPAVNIVATITSNKFIAINNSALLIRNAKHPQLISLPAKVNISENVFKLNSGQFIISIGLNEDAPKQHMSFNQQNEVRSNKVINPYPHLKSRSTPYAALVVSSSNVIIHRNCFRNPLADFEIGTELSEHAKYIDGGTIFENHDLPKDIYTVTDDLHVVPGAKLTIAPGSRLEFMDGIGMLVQGELLRADVTDSNEPIIFTNKKTTLQDVKNIRLMDEEDNEHTLQGRLELFVDNQWGTVCNRSWTVHHAQMVCNQLGLIMDPEYFENWRIFPSQGDLPMTIDNIRCEEREYDITECRHDGLDHNIGASCRPTEVVGVRCTMPHWAGVRYSLLANPPTITGQTTMNNWIIENAGLFDFRNNLFSPALQIDWNYHTFEKLVIKNNFHHGVDIIYNDLTKKPAIRDAYFINNRRDGINIRSGGITIEKVHINNNGNAGIRYNPLISAPTQRDIVSWLDKKDQTDMEANNVFIVPNTELTSIEVHESEMNQRKFLVFKENEYCPIDLFNPCQWMTELEALGNEFGMRGKVVVQLVNRASNMSDEEVLITDISTGQSWSVTKNTIEFPVISKGNRLSLKYTRSYGKPQLILLILFLDTQEYLDRFVHVYESEINGNQYAISSIHYSNLTYHDGTILSRKSQEMLWFQKVNFSRNTDAVLWIYNPQHIIMPNTEIADITYNIDNCSFTENTAIIAQRIFDLDDWNSYILADFSPYYVTEELFLDYWWRPPIGQLAIATYAEPDVLDLKGRMYESKNMTLLTEKWHTFPFYFKADRPYRIVRDLTIMPGATLRIEKGVEVHIWPNVRILVLGNLIAEGTYWEPIRFKPINVTEYNQIKGRTPTRYKRNIETKLHQSEENYLFRMKRKSTIDPIFAEFPSLRRHDPYHQKFDLHLDGNGSYPNAGFLNIFNSTTGESVPSCDRQFTVRNAQVVCRQLGLAVENVYHWVSERWNYNPKIKLVKTYMEPRECLGTEDRLDECLLRMSGNDSQWMCMDNEHFNFIHCGSNKSLSSEYIGNWGSLAFGPVSLELGQELDNEESKLLNVEIVGGGMTHNDSFNCAALQMIRRSPIINSVNVTNSSMDAVQIISPRHSIILTRLNITNNKGQGINVLTNNLQTPTASSIIPQGPLTIPYLAPGLLEMCSAGKILNVYNRILLYYKYDSYPVDCVKVFHSTMGAISFRFLHFNMYESKTNLGRSDSLSIYSDATFKERVLIKKYAAHGFNNHEMPVQSTSGVMALHFRGTAADGIYGFLVEIAVLPNKPDAGKALEITIQHAKMYENDRGAIEYRNTGEMGPQVSIESCAIDKNGYNLYGNISTSSQAVEIHLHNTPTFKFRNNGVTRNIGGLLVTAQTSSGIGLTGIIKSNAFVQNMNSTVIGLIGNNHQNIRIINNIISLNEALYFDNVIVQEMSTNFSGNLFSNNTGIHTINTQGFSQNNKDPQLFYFNNFQDNLALGSGHQYMEHYGFLPEDEVDEFSRRPKRHVLDEGGKNIYLLEDSQFSQSQTLPYYSNSTSSMARPKRQVLTQRGISFDWWTHVGTETSRYRGTILAGNAQHKFHNNVFNDPANDYELVTSASSKFELDVIDATSNYWSYPGTPGVAAGKIRDFNDYKYLIQVQYLPVLESNTSSDDVRQKSLAAKIDYFINRDMTEQERIETYKMSQEANIWMSGINVPSIQCGRMSSKTGSIGTVNCNDLLPFVCEKGTKPYEEPVTWRYAVVFGIILISILLLFIICLTICWCYKSQQREEEHHFRKDSVRKSKRHMSKVNEWNEMKKTTMTQANQMYNNPDGFGSISQAHKNVLNSTPGYGSSGTSSARTGSSRTETSGTGTTTTGTTATGSSLLRPYTSCTSDSLTTDRYTGTAKSGGSSSFVPMQGKVSAQPNPYAEIATLRKGSTNPLILTNNPDFMQDCSCDGTESSTYSSIRGSSLTDDTSTYCEGSERTESDNCSSHTLLAKQSSTPLTTFGKPAQRPMSTFVPNASPSRSQMQNATSNPSLYYEVGQLSNAGVNLGLSKTPATPKPIPTPSTPPSFAKYQPYLQPETNKKSPHLNEVPSRSLVDLAQPKQYSNPFARGGTYKSTEHLKPLETSM
uniref:Beta_helix domain-containing protein n=1 Tax=Rhabditophanes sp. KR3021 TaxID=114890 RepID=A0AC35U2L2_9BILA